jgi:hypothetical protein
MSNAVALRPEQQVAVSFDDITRMGEHIAKSRLFGMQTPDQAIALLLIAHAEGKHPALAARDYDIIANKPAKKAEAMQRDFLLAGGKIKWKELSDEAAEAEFSHDAGGTVTIRWDMKRAQTAGLGGKDMWKKFPRQMLRARCISEGVRTVFPLATSGLYAVEEVSDFQPAPMQDVTPKPSAQEKLDKLTALEETPQPPKAPMTLFDFDACDGSGELLQLTGPDWLAQAEIALNTHEHPATFWKANEAEFYRIQQAATEKAARKSIATCSRVADLAHQAMQAEG